MQEKNNTITSLIDIKLLLKMATINKKEQKIATINIESAKTLSPVRIILSSVFSLIISCIPPLTNAIKAKL